MLITNVQIRDTKTDTRLEAVTSVTFDDMLVVHDIKIISSDEGYFLAMPSRRVPNGTFKDIAHPISKDVRSALERITVDGFTHMREHGLPMITLSLAVGSRKNSMLEQVFSDFVVTHRDTHSNGEDDDPAIV